MPQTIKPVFQNEHFLVVDKASGWLSIPGREGAADKRPCLSNVLTQEFGKVFIVHRLDVEVSGLILFARDAESHRAANLWFENRVVKKTYEALTEGDASPLQKDKTLRWESKLLRGKKRAYESDAGKDAVTEVRFTGLATDDTSMLKWELDPLTGRSHQLRFELAKHGYPICGDKLYGAKSDFSVSSGDAIALRAVRLDFSRCEPRFGLPATLSVEGLKR